MKKYNTWQNRVFDFCVFLLLLILGLSCLIPLLHVIALSLSSKTAALSGKVTLWPVELTFTPYKVLMTDHKFMQAMWISVQRVVLGGAINLVLTVITAFALSQDESDFPARKVYMWFMIFAMLFGASLVPWYFVIKATGLMDTIWALVIPGALPVYNTILLIIPTGITIYGRLLSAEARPITGHHAFVGRPGNTMKGPACITFIFIPGSSLT